MKSENVKEFCLIIIESLYEADKKTGETLFNEVIKYKQFEEPNLSAELWQVVDRQDLFQRFSILRERIKDGMYPILHIETHGGNEGIKISSKEQINWDDLLEQLRQINISMGNQLVLIMAMCVGGAIIGSIMPDLRAPFKIVISSFKEVSQIDLLSGFESFYDSLFFKLNFEEAVDCLNVAMNPEKPTFHIIKSDAVFDSLTDLNRDERHTAVMVNDIAVQLKSVEEKFNNTPFDEVYAIAKKSVSEVVSEIRSKKDYFTMKDLIL